MPNEKKPSTTKSPIAKAADALGAQARLLHKVDKAQEALADAVTDPRAVVQRLSKFAEAERAVALAAEELAAQNAQEVLQPMIEKASKRIADAVALVKQYGPLVDQLKCFDWETILKRTPNRVVPGSEHSTRTQLSMLKRTVDEAHEAIFRASDFDLKQALDAVERLTELTSREAQVATATLAYWMSRSDRPSFIAAKVGAVVKLLNDIDADLASPDAQPPAESVSAASHGVLPPLKEKWTTHADVTPDVRFATGDVR